MPWGHSATYRTPTGVRAVIEDVVVDNSFRGRGIGEALMRGLLDLAHANGREALRLRPIRGESLQIVST